MGKAHHICVQYKEVILNTCEIYLHKRYVSDVTIAPWLQNMLVLKLISDPFDQLQ
jgi:hypothetical protein